MAPFGEKSLFLSNWEVINVMRLLMIFFVRQLLKFTVRGGGVALQTRELFLDSRGNAALRCR